MNKVNQQVVLFPKDFINSDTNSLYTNIIKDLGSIFNGTNQNFPVPIDAPRDFPRIILNDNLGKNSLFMSFDKFDFKFETDKKEDEIIDIIKRVINLTDVKVSRIGVISHFSEKTADDFDIAKKILQEKYTNNLNNYFIQLSYKKEWEGLECNQAITAGLGITDKSPERITLLIVDDNTSLNQNSILDIAQIERFIRTHFTESKTALDDFIR